MLKGITREYEDGQTIFHQGDAAADMYLIGRGHVRIVRILDDGAERELAVLGPGDFFGEIALFDAGPRTATAMAAGPVALEVVDRVTFMEAIQSDPSVKDMLAEMSARIRELQEEK